MKQDFLNLINQIDLIESHFHMSSSSPGLLVPSVEEIYDVPEFQSWIQMIQFELQEIVDATDDEFAKETLKIAKEKYNGWRDKTDFTTLKGKLLAMDFSLIAPVISSNLKFGRRNEVQLLLRTQAAPISFNEAALM